MRPFHAAIIGTGAISHLHASAIQEVQGLELCACWNRVEEEGLGRAFAEKHEVVYYSDIDQMIQAVKPDVAINVLPPKYHYLGLEKAAAVGAALVVEKPMATTVQNARKIIDLAQRYNVLLAISESSAYDAVLRSIIANRSMIGKIRHMLCTNYRRYFSAQRSDWISDPEQCPGGMILNVGVHRIAAMRSLAGAQEVAVHASLGTKPPAVPVVGDGSIMIEYENGAAAMLLMCGYHDCGTHNPNVQNMVGDNGLVRIDADSAIFTASDGKSVRLRSDPRLSNSPYINFYRELQSSLSSGDNMPYSGIEGLQDVAVVEAALLSHREKRVVAIQEVME